MKVTFAQDGKPLILNGKEALLHVEAATKTDVIHSKEVKEFCDQHDCRVWRVD